MESFKPEHDGNTIREKDLARAENLLEQVKKRKESVDKQASIISKLEEEIKLLNDKLNDLKKHSDFSLEKARKLNEQLKKNR